VVPVTLLSRRRPTTDTDTDTDTDCVACGQPAPLDRGGVPLHSACARQINDTVARETVARSSGRGR
jgi:hypothetical protein